MRKSRLSWYKQELLILHFVSGSTARCVANLAGVNNHTAAFYYHRFRALVATNLEQEAEESGAPHFGELEVDKLFWWSP